MDTARPEELLAKNLEQTTQYVDTTDPAAEASVSFVAEDLNERLKLSPLASINTTPTTSVVSSPYPPLVPDAQCLRDLEAQASTIAQNLDRLMLEMKGTLHGMSLLTTDNVRAYAKGVCRTCDAVDNSIKSIYQLMAKVEEITTKLGELPRLAQQIREIKRVLDLFELHLQKSAG